MLMSFGKHKGEPLADIPRSYLRWLLDQDWLYDPGKEKLVEEIEAECATRDRSYDTY